MICTTVELKNNNRCSDSCESALITFLEIGEGVSYERTNHYTHANQLEGSIIEVNFWCTVENDYEKHNSSIENFEQCILFPRNKKIIWYLQDIIRWVPLPSLEGLLQYD
jgi:hypothetical protein